MFALLLIAASLPAARDVQDDLPPAHDIIPEVIDEPVVVDPPVVIRYVTTPPVMYQPTYQFIPTPTFMPRRFSGGTYCPPGGT